MDIINKTFSQLMAEAEKYREILIEEDIKTTHDNNAIAFERSCVTADNSSDVDDWLDYSGDGVLIVASAKPENWYDNDIAVAIGLTIDAYKMAKPIYEAFKAGNSVIEKIVQKIDNKYISIYEACKIIEMTESAEIGDSIAKLVLSSIENSKLSPNQAYKIYNIAIDKPDKIDKITQKLDHVISGKIMIDQLEKELEDPHVAYNGGNNEWYTPEPYITAAVNVMGAIDLDPATSILANKVVGAKKIYTIEDDGLTQQWRGRVWLNPPYASELITKFCSKLRDHFVASEVTEAIVLVNNATETAWFNTLVQCASAVVFTTSRVRFYAPDGKKSQPLQGQAVIYLGNNVVDFIKYFEQFGWSTIIHKKGD